MHEVNIVYTWHKNTHKPSSLIEVYEHDLSFRGVNKLMTFGVIQTLQEISQILMFIRDVNQKFFPHNYTLSVEAKSRNTVSGKID